jgi:hypothetical protein
MATKRRIEITVETEQVTVSRPNMPSMNEAANQAAWCAGCQCHVLMIGLGQAAQLASLSFRQLVSKTELNELHFYEPPDGSLLFCLASLSQWLRRGERATLALPSAYTNSEEER